MDNQTRIPLIVVETWYKKALSTTMKNFQQNQPNVGDIDPEDPNFLKGAWEIASIFLKVEYERWEKAVKEVHDVGK